MKQLESGARSFSENVDTYFIPQDKYDQRQDLERLPTVHLIGTRSRPGYQYGDTASTHRFLSRMPRSDVDRLATDALVSPNCDRDGGAAC